jgi:hypothetical protein
MNHVSHFSPELASPHRLSKKMAGDAELVMNTGATTPLSNGPQLFITTFLSAALNAIKSNREHSQPSGPNVQR